MKFIVDENLPPRLVGWLEARGHEAIHVLSLGLRQAPDAAIWAKAGADGAVVLTRDADFMGLQGAARAARLCLGNCSNDALFSWLALHWVRVEKELSAGAQWIELKDDD